VSSVEKTAAFELAPWRLTRPRRAAADVRVFGGALGIYILAAAILATWLPLQISIVTVFLFAGPHNWFELRYFLLRLPARFGRSRTFFVTAFAGLGFLTVTYVSLPLLYRYVSWPNETWLVVLATWNTILLAWLVVLVRLRAQQKRTVNWSWTIPTALAIAALNWLGPEFFSLALVYVHPLIALWFLDRQIKRTRPEWLNTYRRCLCFLPVILALVIWRLSQATSLSDDNGLFWRITQHSGAQLLPQVSSHLLVSVHLFLEMLHYGVWILALPLLGPRFWDFSKKPSGFSRSAMLVVGVVVVILLWVGFAMDYATTRDIYFTIAIAHVLAEAPFLLKAL